MSNRFPTPPNVIARILEVASDPDRSASDLAKVLEKDAVLSAQLLRSVNSPAYGLRHKVASVNRATAIMGIRAVRNLVLCLSVRNLMPAPTVGTFPLAEFWETSLRRAAATRCLAECLERTDVEEIFTLGLFQDLGVLVRVGEDQAFAAEAAGLLRETHGKRREAELRSGSSHDEVGFKMLSEWSLPEELVVPIRWHHRPDEAPEEHRLQARMAHAAEAIADLTWAEDKHGSLQAVESGLAKLGLEVDVGRICERVNELVTDFAELLGLNVTEQPDIEQILALASDGLASLNDSYEKSTQQLEQQNVELRRQALTDGLTGLPNRRSFDAALERELAMAHRQGSTISLLILDVDRFKTFNDTHGHQAGDEVLREVGNILGVQSRASDTVARYGGEEFALILPFTGKEGARQVADRIRQAIESAEVTWEGQALSVTASLGGVTLESIGRVPPELGSGALREADEALYAAKQQGRNRVCWASPCPVAGA